MSQATSSSPDAGTSPRSDADLQDRVRSLRLNRIPGGASYGRTAVAWAFGLAVLGVCAWLGYQAIAQRVGTEKLAEKQDASTKQNQREAEPVARPASAAVTPKGDIALEAQGNIIPAHQSLVSPKVSGMIVELHIEEGKRFNAGDLLAVIESEEYQYDLNRAVATEQAAAARWREAKRRLTDMKLEIDQTQAQLDETIEQVKQLQLEWDRKRGLRKSGAINEQEFEEIDSKLKIAKKHQTQLEFAHELMKTTARQERLEAAQGDWDQAKAEVQKAKWKLDNCRIVAPIKGTILRKNAEKGNNVNPIAQQGSTSLCEMADLSDLEVELDIQERDVSVVHPGQRCSIRTDAYPDRVYSGVVSRLMPIANRGKGAIPVRVKVSVPADEEGVYLKPDMGAKVTFLKSAVAKPEGRRSVPTSEVGAGSAFPADPPTSVPSPPGRGPG